MRKTKACTITRLMTMAGRLVARTCERERAHEGRHHDRFGSWELEKADA